MSEKITEIDGHLFYSSIAAMETRNTQVFLTLASFLPEEARERPGSREGPDGHFKITVEFKAAPP